MAASVFADGPVVGDTAPGFSSLSTSGRMFDLSDIEGKTVLADKAADSMISLNWQQFWLIPAIMATVILVIFLLAFHDKARLGVTKKDAVEAA